ncbi:MAG TPA: hypothetical protein VK203_14430 [Nostocaceae cyanobacterium]|nr:hypothetical protein [Nostocaceae cyanobacterium]
MKIKAFTTGLIIGFLVGCSGTNQDTTVQPVPKQQESEPTKVTESTKTPSNSELKQTDAPVLSRQAIAEAALLTREQVEQLVSHDKNNETGINFKVIVPTYVPSGFKIDKFEITKGTFGPDYNLEGYNYKISYRNSNNLCFSIYSQGPGGGGDPEGYETLTVSSPALGKVAIEYTKSDQIEEAQYIVVEMVRGILKGNHIYSFVSTNKKHESCKIISLEEAVKIVESLQYLNP